MVMKSVKPPSKVKKDYDRIHRMSSLDKPMAIMFRNYESSVRKIVTKLRDMKVDVIICIPLKHGTNLENVYDNLNRLELPSETGVLLGAEKYVKTKDNWSIRLLKMIERMENRFAFCEPIPMASTEVFLKGELKRYIDKVRAVQKNAGVIDPAPVNYGIMAAREELRIIVKQLICRYVFWFDADLKVPKNVIPKLLKNIDIADIIAGWALDRHLPFKSSSVFTDKPIQVARTTEDEEYYEQGRIIINKIIEGLKKSMILDPTEIIIYEKRIRDEYEEGGYSIPPFFLESKNEPIRLKWAGFECAMTKKVVNDRSTFLKNKNMIIGAEDYTFCIEARKLGYRVAVDPTCKCH